MPPDLLERVQDTDLKDHGRSSRRTLSTGTGLDHARTDDSCEGFVGALGQAGTMRIKEGSSAGTRDSEAGEPNQRHNRCRSPRVMDEETTNGDCLMTGKPVSGTEIAVGNPLEGSGDRLGDA